MKFYDTPFTGPQLVATPSNADARGSFARVFCEEEFAPLRSGLRWAQINVSRTDRKGTVRGMHFQYPPAAEAKLIRCLRGRIFDVIVDVRAGSPTFLRWYGVELSEQESQQLFIPEGFAHGFQTLSDDVQLLYLHTAPWCRECEGRIRYDDPALAITWPLSIVEASERDKHAALISDTAFAGVRL